MNAPLHRVTGSLPDPETEIALDAGLLAIPEKNVVHQIHGLMVEFDALVRIGRETFHVANLASRKCTFKDGSPPVISSLLLDERGRFFGMEVEDAGDELTCAKVLARLADGKQAMAWIAHHLIGYGPLSEQFEAAIENPSFEFLPMIPEGPKRRKRRAKKESTAPPFAVQLEMATALVAIIQKLDADPRPETLAEGRRNVSKLHRDLYSTETFRAVANG